MKKVFLLPFLFPVFLFTGSQLPNIEPPSLKVKTVVIDAGHGGKDPGCHGDLYKEKDIALAVALKLGHFIEDNFQDVKVVFTRKTDVFVELNERAAIANRNNADLFICVHCNSACVYDKRTRKETCNEEAHGSETYVMGVHKNAGNLEVAKRENQSILMEDDYKKKYDGFDPNSDEANIIFTFYQNVFLNQSLSLASKIQECYKQKAGRNDKGVKQAGFLVLWRTAMPSLLTEIGYLTNHKEEKFLGSEKGQNYMASSIFRAFRMYKSEVEGLNIKYSDDFEKVAPYDPTKDTSESPEPVKPLKKPDPSEKTTSKESAKVDPAGLPAVKPAPVEKKDTTADDKYRSSMDSGFKDGKSRKPEPKSSNPASIPAQPHDRVTSPASNEHSALPAENANPATVPAAAGKNEPMVYKVLFLVSEKKLNPDDKKLSGVEGVDFYQEGGAFKYTAGNYQKMNEATQYQSELRKKGFKDAFVVSFRAGKRVK
ncbi:MAG TPA: N-acetylmuramoyl-L-alanine amidase [Bacteroidia bacterium]|nr:N-acetylmuramoyl-L-alanine amidase [Bacteroidia bacterium]